jgi:hypothetical protein
MARSKHISSECVQKQKERWMKSNYHKIKYNLNFTLSKCNELFYYFYKKNPLVTKLNVLILCFLDFTYISIHQHVLIMLLLSFIIVIVVNECFLDGNLLSKFNLKNMILFYTKKYFMKWITQNCQFSKIILFQIINFFCDKFQLHVVKNIELSSDCLIFISSL